LNIRSSSFPAAQGATTSAHSLLAVEVELARRRAEDATGLQRGQDFRQVLALDMGMNVPVEIGEAAKQRAILECVMSGSLGRPMKGSRTPMKPSRLIASSADRSTGRLKIAVPRSRWRWARSAAQM
jgi:hypothetical protein